MRAASDIKYKAALGVAYGAGLRVSEVAHLKIDDIDSKRMLIRVEEGKGRKDRNAMLSPQLLELLRFWWREGKRRRVLFPHSWMFTGRSYTDPISSRQLHRAVQEAAEVAGKRVSQHTLRHSFAAHLLEQDVDIRVIQVPHSEQGAEYLRMSLIRSAGRSQFVAKGRPWHNQSVGGGLGRKANTLSSRFDRAVWPV